MMKSNIKLILILIIFLFSQALISAGVFDNIKWEYVKSKNNIRLYIQQNNKAPINFYKAETVLSNVNADFIIENIVSFEKYSKIFDKTKYFKIIKKINENKFFLTAELNFSPYKNRVYFIECDSIQKKILGGKTKYTVEWYPLTPIERSKIKFQNNKAQEVKYIYGRWTVIPLDDNRVYVSIEYHNNWETNLPFSFVTKIEKMITIKNLATLITYSKKKYKNNK